MGRLLNPYLDSLDGMTTKVIDYKPKLSAAIDKKTKLSAATLYVHRSVTYAGVNSTANSNTA